MAKRMQPTQIVVPTWRTRRGEEYFGPRWGDWRGMDDTVACWLSLRGHVPEDKYSYMRDDCKAIGDVGVYVWVSRDGTVSLDLRVHDVHSLELRELERLTKLLKALHAKAAKGGYAVGSWTFIKTRDIHGELVKLFDALGVRQSVQYNGPGTEDTFIPIGLALIRISQEIEAQITRQGGWKEQAQEAA